MKTKSALFIAIMCLINSVHAQPNEPWRKWSWLTGEWVGEGAGEPGKGSGSFSFKPDLDNKVLIRRNHSAYPATTDKPATIHNDLMVVYLDYTGAASKAIYFDNEGHTINYNITYSDSAIVLTSEKISHVPVFRLTYTLIDKETVNVKFQMSQDGDKFMTYVEGLCKRKKG